MQLDQLIPANQQTQRFAVQQVNNIHTIRYWVIGFYLEEYEQEGEHRALQVCRSFYLTYPQIWRSVSAKFQLIKNKLGAGGEGGGIPLNGYPAFEAHPVKERVVNPFHAEKPLAPFLAAQIF